MKKYFSLTILLFACLAVTSYADSEGKVNIEIIYGVEWEYTSCDNGVEILGANAEGDVIIPSKLGGIHVTAIGDEAFARCSNLTSIEIPSSVTTIGVGAFAGCSNLTSIEVAKDNPNYTSIGDVLFSKDMTKLIFCSKDKTSYTVPSSVTAIGDEAFVGCSNLTSIEIPSSVTTIGDVAFARCSNLTSINIPSSVTTIGRFVFSDCESLTSIKIPSSVTSIGDGAFYGCDSLTSIEIPSSVTTIGNSAFYGCDRLVSIKLPRKFSEDRKRLANEDYVEIIPID